MNNNESKSKSELFTQRSLENLSSPEQLKDYLKITGMPVWIIMIAILVILVGLFVWSTFATLTSYVSVDGVVKDGAMTVTLQGDALDDAAQEDPGEELNCRIGNLETILIVSGTDAKGNRIAAGAVPLSDGVYDVRVGYKQKKAIRLLLN